MKQKIRRSYREDVLARLDVLRASGKVLIEQYGSLTIDPEKFPVFAARVGDGAKAKKTILITGGVHGYETSGVKGALLFLEKHVWDYVDRFNFVVFPCISPWSYETVNRLNPIMENPNRNFKRESTAEESRLVMDHLLKLNLEFEAHIDLHETTDSDKLFIPEEYSKNGIALDASQVDIPDGFYLIGVAGAHRPDVEKAMIESVRKVTHIAQPDAKGEILDTPLSHEGMIHSSIPGLLAEYTSATSRWGGYTTEMYPDSQKLKALGQAGAEATCCDAQVACIRGGLDFWSGVVTTARPDVVSRG